MVLAGGLAILLIPEAVQARPSARGGAGLRPPVSLSAGKNLVQRPAFRSPEQVNRARPASARVAAPGDLRQSGTFRTVAAIVLGVGASADRVGALLRCLGWHWKRAGGLLRWPGALVGGAGTFLRRLLGTRALRATALEFQAYFNLAPAQLRYLSAAGAGVSLYTGSLDGWDATQGRPEPHWLLPNTAVSAFYQGVGIDRLNGPSARIGLPFVRAVLARNGSQELSFQVPNLGSIAVGHRAGAAPGVPARGPYLSFSMTVLGWTSGSTFIGPGLGLVVYHPALAPVVVWARGWTERVARSQERLRRAVQRWLAPLRRPAAGAFSAAPFPAAG
jgi:hypothetical protein